MMNEVKVKTKRETITKSMSTHNPKDDKKVILRVYRELFRHLNKWADAGSKKLIKKAFHLASAAHFNMRRGNGEPYIIHPISVAIICLKEIGLGIRSTVCALLHDTVEDTNITLKDIENKFGKEIASIIEGLTKISSFDEKSTSKQIENFKYILMTIAKDPRVVLIKLADRLHNMRTLEYLPKVKQLKIASETSYIYAPLAHRLGLYNIKTEMEDIAMKFIEPDIYKDITNKIYQTKRERTRYINEFIKPLKQKLLQLNIPYEIVGRPKSISSIWQKMQKKQVAFEEVYDLFAIRIIIDTPYELERDYCWKVYSMVTSFYRPLPDRLRDWISTPKNNGYEALHITVLGNHGRWVEVQIRTKRMNHIAEKGLAAHHKYKEGVDKIHKIDKFEVWMSEIRNLIQQKNLQKMSSYDFLQDFKTNFLSEEVYVFTPKGDIKMLPKGSTVLDFAFTIHSKIGSTIIGAKINKKLVPIHYILRNGDQIEIKTSNNQTPKEDWLNYAFTSKTKSKIKEAIRKHKLLEIELGKDIVKKYFEDLCIAFDTDNLNFIIQKYSFKNHIDFFHKVQNQVFDIKKIKDLEINNNHFIQTKDKHSKRTSSKPQNKSITPSLEDKVENILVPSYKLPILFEGKQENYVASLASCCKPILGDDIIGFITSGEGIKIHRVDCKNAKYLMAVLANRVIKVTWNTKTKDLFQTTIKLDGLDRVGILHIITALISNQFKINIEEMTFKTHNGLCNGILKLSTSNKNQLDNLLSELSKIDGIKNVIRLDNN